ncbi:WYL domain-containing protein [Janthinobacterium sp. LB2P10]|uniref:WYL domain-containing protein n=1 Tax=Janthinobacterium sp. LB2P10 TaxID=3424194 RepID=UPI003F25480B
MKVTDIGLSQTQRERLAVLELQAFFTGELQRGDIESRFGIKPAAASRDLSIYREIAPGNLDFDQLSRRYLPADGFTPIFKFHPERVLSWLLLGFGDGLELGLKLSALCKGLGQLPHPDMDILAAITRALFARRPIRINYLSLSSGPKRRDIVPAALANNGKRWQVRSFDRECQRFGDFVLTRITKVQELDYEPEARKLLSADEQWARIVDLEIVPHPGIKQLKAIKADYAMTDGLQKIKTRAALAGHVLRRWSIDTSPDHRLDPDSHHLSLRNTPILYGVESAMPAPGVEPLEPSRDAAISKLSQPWQDSQPFIRE